MSAILANQIDFSTSSRKLGIRGSNRTRKGSGCALPVSVKAKLSIGEEGSSEILNAHNRYAVLINTDRLATCCPGQTLGMKVSYQPY